LFIIIFRWLCIIFSATSFLGVKLKIFKDTIRNARLPHCNRLCGAETSLQYVYIAVPVGLLVADPLLFC